MRLDTGLLGHFPGPRQERVESGSQLAQPTTSTEVSPMSEYSKPHPYTYHGEATRSNPLPSYPGAAQPPFASQYSDAPVQLSHERPGADMPFIPSSTYESRGLVDHHRPDSSFMDARSRHPASLAATDTEVTEPITPAQGVSGSTVSLQLRTNHALDTEQYVFVLMFGSKKCVAALQSVDYHDEWHNYLLNVEVPPFPLTNSWNPTMMLKLQIEDKMGNRQWHTNAGKFTFTDLSPNLTYQSSPDLSRKRKISSCDLDDDVAEYAETHVAKRIDSGRYHAKPRSMSGPYSAAQLSPLPAQSRLMSAYGLTSGYELSKQPDMTSPFAQKGLYAVSSGLGISQSEYKVPQMTTGLSSYAGYGSLSSLARNPTSMAVTSPTVSVLPTPSALAAPVLVRATTLPQAGSVNAAQPFNPYSMYQSKAVLKIEGDLDKMSDNWSQDEFTAKRRLVEFKRSQQGSTITTSFAPTTPEARPARSICVSCIWWEEKDEWFITSVDTIYLLEQLVNVRFTVEEKNRIRRNLEGFRPLTVSKAKQDSEEFFKVIMGFPNPKPRNIEKDVKVFPWKILSHALKKIISKYSASYSSTAGLGSLPIPSTSTYAPNTLSHATLDAHRDTSPQSVSASTVSTAYTPQLTSSHLSPRSKISADVEGSAGQGLSLSRSTPSAQDMTQWASSTHQLSQYPTPLPQTSRGSWDYGYLHTSAAMGLPAVAQASPMGQPGLKGDIHHIPTTY